MELFIIIVSVLFVAAFFCIMLLHFCTDILKYDIKGNRTDIVRLQTRRDLDHIDVVVHESKINALTAENIELTDRVQQLETTIQHLKGAFDHE